MRRDEGLLHLDKVAVIFGPFDPLGNEGSLGDPSGNEGSLSLRERRDPFPFGNEGTEGSLTGRNTDFHRRSSGKLHKDYTVYEDVKSILPIYIHVYPVRPCRDDLCEIIPSL